MARKAHGTGRLALQKKLRGDRSKFVAKLLLDRLDVGQIQRAMVIFPANSSLRKRKWRRVFSCLSFIAGRVYTKRLCCNVVKKILKALPFEINLKPGHSLATFVEAQGERMRRCARAIRKMTDLEETQPLDAEEARYVFRLKCCKCSEWSINLWVPSANVFQVLMDGFTAKAHAWGVRECRIVDHCHVVSGTGEGAESPTAVQGSTRAVFHQVCCFSILLEKRWGAY